MWILESRFCGKEGGKEEGMFNAFNIHNLYKKRKKNKMKIFSGSG